MRRRGDLLAFADDMLVLTNSKAELEETIHEIEALASEWNLRMNKDKSQVLTKDTCQDVAGSPA